MEEGEEDSSTSEDAGHGRGRGQGGRGRGQGVRGRGRARGRRAAAAERNRADEALHTVQTRRERMRDVILGMTGDRAKELLLEALESHPGLIFEVIEPVPVQPGGYHPPEGAPVPDWCVCTRCREMPTLPERVCCGKRRDRCLSTLPHFDVLVLDEAVLALARIYRNDVLVLNEEVDLMRANRHQGYRQFTLWQHGRLGAGNRRVVLSCCVWKIRDRFPDAFGQYTGYLPGRLN